MKFVSQFFILHSIYAARLNGQKGGRPARVLEFMIQIGGLKKKDKEMAVAE